VQLFKDHQLITNGPYAIVCHPMYVGLILAALGSLLIYFTWTTVYFACYAPLMIVRARREETALLAEFGKQWQEYCQHVQAFIPRWRKER
jgi:methanethiol S-methyltransferase